MEHEGILGHLWTSNSCTIRTTFDRTIGLTIIEKPFTAKWLQASLRNSNNELVTWRITTWYNLDGFQGLLIVIDQLTVEKSKL